VTVNRSFSTAIVCAVAAALSLPPPGMAAEQGQSPPPADDAVLATVGAEVITAGNLRREMARRGRGLPGQYATAEQRRTLLGEMITYRATVARARSEGYADDPEVIAILERAMVTKLRTDLLEGPQSAIEISEDEMAGYYADHVSDYDRPERFRAAIVVFEVPPTASAETRRAIGDRARRALTEVDELDPSITHFGPVARRYSDDRASRYSGGVIGWIVRHPDRRSKWEKPVVDAIFALQEPGEVGPIVETDAGFYLVRLVAHEPSTPRPYDEVKNGIRHQLLRERAAAIDHEFTTETLDETEITINEDVLAGVEAPAAANEPVDEMRPPRLPVE
jgi:parvulin-like peptidyl-prolyl isomerase